MLLWLAGNEIGVEGGTALAGALKINTYLEHLNLNSKWRGCGHVIAIW